MTLEEFVSAFSGELTETDPKSLSAKTKFRDLPEWSSLFAIDVFAILSQNYVNVNLYDLTDCETIEDIYNIVQTMQNKASQPKEGVLTNTYWKD